jgi:uncharacterized membrane protein
MFWKEIQYIVYLQIFVEADLIKQRARIIDQW